MKEPYSTDAEEMAVHKQASYDGVTCRPNMTERVSLQFSMAPESIRYIGVSTVRNHCDFLGHNMRLSVNAVVIPSLNAISKQLL